MGVGIEAQVSFHTSRYWAHFRKPTHQNQRISLHKGLWSHTKLEETVCFIANSISEHPFHALVM